MLLSSMFVKVERVTSVARLGFVVDDGRAFVAASAYSGLSRTGANLMQPLFHRQPVTDTLRFRFVPDFV